jgi:cytochrome c biogenesis protein CcdA
MSDLLPLFLAGFTASFGPCLLTCSPVMLPFITGTRQNLRQGISAAIVFSLVRTLTFVQLGILVAVLGSSLTTALSRYHTLIAVITGAVIALLGIIIMLGKDLQSRFCRILHQETAGGLKGAVILGVLMGILPCVGKLGVLAFVAVRAHTIWRGAAMSLAFALGEAWSPIIILTAFSGILPQMLRTPRAQLILSRVSGFFVFAIGLFLILRPA